MKRTNIYCPYCGAKATLHSASYVYGETAKTNDLLYGCDRYPKCKTTYSGIPNGEKCEVCNGPMITTADGVRCGNEKCKTVIALKKALLEKTKINLENK